MFMKKNRFVIKKTFKSKKNKVKLVLMEKSLIVMKQFNSKNMLEGEYKILRRGCERLNIPKPLGINIEGKTLFMSYIPSKNLCDVINSSSVPLKVKNECMEKLASWLVDFHSYFKSSEGVMIRGDSILRNFILDEENNIWGLDFEESRYGMPEEDIAGICSSVLDTNPMFTNWKVELCKRFIDAYKSLSGWEVKNVNKLVFKALMEKAGRRKNGFVLIKFAKSIENLDF